MSKSRFLYSLLLLTAFLSLPEFSSSQNATSSPYSRFGIGDIAPSVYAKQLGMGGLQTAIDNPFSINPGNPASYSSLVMTTYEGGLNFLQYELKSSVGRQRTNTASLSYFHFAFPVKNGKWALGFGLSPYSNVGYKLTSQTTNLLGDQELKTYKGSGGLNNFHIGTGFKLGRIASFGFSTEYLFGVINRDRTVEFNSTNYIYSNISESTSIGWFHFNTGFQFVFDSLKTADSDSLKMFDKKITLLTDSLKKTVAGGATDYELKNGLRQQIEEAKFLRTNVVNRKVRSDWRLTAGITFSPSIDLRARNTYVNNSYRYVAGSTTVLIRDTVQSYDGQRGFVRLPSSLGVGLTLRKGPRWLVGTDFRFQQWSKFSYLGSSDSLVNGWRSAFGLQYIPNERALKSYWKVMQYRAGFHYENGYLKLGGQQLAEMGVSAGLTLPIRRGGSQLHLAFEIGKRGTTKDNLIEEKYLRFTLGFTINDRWFLKPKYD